MSFDRRWLDEQGSEDSHGRALWALGICVGRSPCRSFQVLAGQTLRAGPAGGDGVHLAARLGLQPARHPRIPAPAQRRPPRQPDPRNADRAARCDALDGTPRTGLAVVRGGAHLRQRQARPRPDSQRPRHGPTRRSSRRGLQRPALAGRRCRPPRTATSGPSAATASTRAAAPRANFDQQPIEAQAMVSACLEAYRATADCLVVRTGPARLRLVPRPQRSGPGTLLPRNRRLPRRPARGPGQPEPGRRIDARLPALARGNAPCAEHR